MSDLDQVLNRDVWTDDVPSSAGMETIDVPLVSVGGGFGSFAVVNLLRTAGAPTEKLAVLTRNHTPHETYSYLARNSQIGNNDRLRSDSSAMPDNLWGFPSYALREARRGDLSQAVRVSTEPMLMEFFTPISGEVYRSTEQEASRIGWEEMTRFGQARAIRPRVGGGYFTVFTETSDRSKRRVAYRSRYVHLAPGYAGATFLPDLQDYRDRTGDITHVVNAYEHHEHVYLDCQRQPRTVLIRGSGIVASRVLERLLTDREQGRSQTTVIHLFRRYPKEATSGRHPRVVLGFTQQPFNLCKSAFGGSMAEQIERSDDAEGRVTTMNDAAGTTTAARSDWFDQLERGRQGGFYQQTVGTVRTVDQDADERLAITVDGADGPFPITADYIIDSTGLQGGARDHRLLNDLIEHLGAPTNPMGRVSASRSFEIEHLRAEPGKLFITGAMSMGNYFGPVDSFYGLQWAAWRVVDALAADGFVKRIGMGRSTSQWWRRMRGKAP